KESINYFTIVKEVNGDTICFFDPEKHKWTFCNIDAFLNRCTLIALLAEQKEDAGERDYDKKNRQDKSKLITQYIGSVLIPVIAIVSGIISLFEKGTGALLPFIYILFALIGTVISLLLLLFELDKYNPILQKICSGGEKVNCNAILQSKVSKVLGISWSTIGFTYFMGQLLIFLFYGITSPKALFIIAWINTLAVPYVFFSIYYQWRIAKQWCILCLSVQLLLVLQLTTEFLGGWHTLMSLNSVNIKFIIESLTAFILPFLMVNLLMPALRKAKENELNRIQLQHLKHNEQIFTSLLAKQKIVTQSANGLGIILGNPNAKHKLIKVCSPYCEPCAQAHRPMEELLDNNPDLQIQIIFNVRTYNYDSTTPPTKHLLAIAEKANEKQLRQALDHWYFAKIKNYETFAAKYPMNGELLKQDNKINAMEKWCNNMDITFTPTFFVSIPWPGEETFDFYQLPKMYTVNDLKYFLSV
ncbi:MAG: vitamin K epoxide reductase family protein, partial [Sediminibacterium sp.]|nr:vitamin K epoxide reductase family protein [Sediminibacterium sp.]